MLDIDTLEAALDDAETGANGFTHRQSGWCDLVDYRDPECGTALCLAGFSAVRLGAKPPVPHLASNGDYMMSGWFINQATGETAPMGNGLVPEGAIHVSDWVQRKLGLTLEQAETLWYASSEDLRPMIEELRRNPEAGSTDMWEAAELAKAF